MFGRIASTAIAALTLTLAEISLAQPAPLGPDFLVNTYTTYTQRGSSVSAAPNGDFVVVWCSYNAFLPGGQDGDTGGIFGQRYSSSGAALGTEFQVNSFTSFHQNFPDVAFGPNGDFVAAWTSAPVPMLNGGGIRARRFASDGSPIGNDFQVETTFNYSTTSPAVAVAPTGDFVVVWQFMVTPDILGQRFDSTGTPVGTEFVVNTYTYDGEISPDVACNSLGDFVVVWESGFGLGGHDGSYGGVFAQRYASDGSRIGVEFQVNTYTTNTQYDPSISFAPNDDFVITWTDRAARDGDTDAVFLQRFSSSGAQIGTELQVNTVTVSHQKWSEVSHDPVNGDFVVAWESGYNSVRAQKFGSDGSPQGPEFRVNQSINPLITRLSITGQPNGQFVVAWESNNQAAYNIDVVARLFDGTFTPTEAPTATATVTATPTPAPLCAPTPLSGCFAAGKTVLLIRSDAAEPGKDKLLWKWLQGAATTAGDLGTPTGTTSYAFCVYDQGGPVLEADVPPGGTCGTAPCWKATGSGFKYKDKALANDGVKIMKLQSGGAGQSKAKLKGQGANLPDPVLPLTVPVTAQLVNSDGSCWSATYSSTPLKNESTQFKAKE